MSNYRCISYLDAWNRWSLCSFGKRAEQISVPKRVAIAAVKCFAFLGAAALDFKRLVTRAHDPIVTPTLSKIATVLELNLQSGTFASIVCDRIEAKLEQIGRMTAEVQASEMWEDFLNDMAKRCQDHQGIREIKTEMERRFKGQFLPEVLVQEKVSVLESLFGSGYERCCPTIRVQKESCFVPSLFARIRYEATSKTWDQINTSVPVKIDAFSSSKLEEERKKQLDNLISRLRKLTDLGNTTLKEIDIANFGQYDGSWMYCPHYFSTEVLQKLLKKRSTLTLETLEKILGYYQGFICHKEEFTQEYREMRKQWTILQEQIANSACIVQDPESLKLKLKDLSKKLQDAEKQMERFEKLENEMPENLQVFVNSLVLLGKFTPAQCEETIGITPQFTKSMKGGMIQKLHREQDELRASIQEMRTLLDQRKTELSRNSRVITAIDIMHLREKLSQSMSILPLREAQVQKVYDMLRPLGIPAVEGLLRVVKDYKLPLKQYAKIMQRFELEMGISISTERA